MRQIKIIEHISLDGVIQAPEACDGADVDGARCPAGWPLRSP